MPKSKKTLEQKAPKKTKPPNTPTPPNPLNPKPSTPNPPRNPRAPPSFLRIQKAQGIVQEDDFRILQRLGSHESILNKKIGMGFRVYDFGGSSNKLRYNEAQQEQARDICVNCLHLCPFGVPRCTPNPYNFGHSSWVVRS